MKPTTKGYYICSNDSTHRISWEVWHEQMLFPEDEAPGTCGFCKGPYRFFFHPTAGIPDANAPVFVPPDMEEFINGVG